MLSLWKQVLLLGLVLQLGFSLPQAAEDYEEEQKEDEAREDVTREEDRGPPTDVAVTTVSGTALNVSWEEPVEKPQYYTVEVTAESINEISYDTYYLLENLKPCTTYWVIVTSSYGDTVQYPGFPESGDTSAEVPPAPGSCNVADATNTTMRVVWAKPETSCLLRNYRLRWTWDSICTDEKGSNETEVESTSYILVDLPPYSNVTIEVAGSTVEGFGDSTFCWGLTAPGTRAPPRNVTVKTLSSSGLNVSWVPPDELPLYYQVDLSPNTYNASSKTSFLVAEGLQSCKNYVVIVRSVYEDSLIFSSSSSSSTTDISVPPEPAGCWVLGEDDFSEVVITWSEPPTECVIVNYNISWVFEDLWQGGLNGSGQNFTTREAITLTDLPPYSNVSVEVAASTEKGFGNATTCWGWTSQDVPGPPFLDFLEVQHDSINVFWSEPEEKNGIVDDYMIHWQDSEGGSFNISTGEAVDSFTISDLTACMTYAVFVQAHTGGGWGSESDADEAVITNYVTESSFKCQCQEARKVELTWRMASPDCPVSRYSLVWETDVLWLHQNSSNATTISGSDTSVTFTNVEPFTLFAAHLTPKGVDDEIEEYCSIITPQEEPSKPTGLEVVNTTTTTATVSWSLPEHLNGVLDQWHLTWSWKNDSGNETCLVASELQYTIEDLVPDTTYLVTIKAHNDGGYGEPEMVEVVTNAKYTPPLGLIIGLSVGGSLLLILVLAALGFYIYKRPKRQASEDESDSVNVEDEVRDTYSTDLSMGNEADYKPLTEKPNSSRCAGMARMWMVVSLLLLGFKLLSATEDFEEQQKEDEHMENESGEDYGLPKNLTVEEVGPTSLNVTWLPPTDADDPQYYSIIWDSQNEVSYETWYLVTDVCPCKTYVFSVRSVYPEFSSLPVTASGSTSSAEPPAPEACSLSEVTTNSMRVDWSKPDTVCLITNYSISWRLDSLWSDDEDSGDIIATNLYTDLRDLMPFANVTVMVAGSTEAGFGLPTTCWELTQEDKPGAPVIEDVSPDGGAISVTWSPPVEANGRIMEYEVVLQDKDGSYVNISVSGTDQTVLIEGLKECVSYTVAVRAMTGAGWGSLSDPLSTTTLGKIPLASVNCSTDHRNVKVCWMPAHEKCPAKQFNVAWVGVSSWANETLSGNGQVPWRYEEVCEVLEDTMPFAHYNICVAVDDNTDGGKCCSQVSPEEAPGPPVLTEVVVEGTTIIASWSDPVDKNGIIDQYVITWEDTMGVTGSDSVGKDMYTFAIRDLDCCQIYSVKVRAHTGGGWGEDSKAEEAAIPNAISDTICNSEGSRRVEVLWRLVSDGCLVPQYCLSWDTRVLWSQDVGSDSSVLDGSVTSFEISHLKPFTEVQACLSIVGGDYESICCSNTTEQEEPSKPTDLQVTDISSSTATFNWSLPENLNGVLDKWHLTWSWRNETVNGTDLDASQTKYTIENLLPKTSYSVNVRAGNGAGLGDPAEIDITTEDRSPPQNTGAIVGASVGVCLLLVAVAMGAYYVYKKKSRTPPSAPPSVKGSPVEEWSPEATHDTYSLDMYKRQQENYREQQNTTQKTGTRKGQEGTHGRYTPRSLSFN
ncbi:phosphatidylinositol phosphatase PTPRQ-like [Panulirus ornatus]|uniref:phosphatidylinositol phosphatase PTPRQ-like n=1 Tax=Panulirus ornatus TaxID=150431 RepID=UPI003A84125D